jgi:hypothetical protein
MGGKRPDQYRIDPAEAGASDYKFRPLGPKEAAVQDRIDSEVMEGSARRGQPLMPSVPDPDTRHQKRKRSSRSAEAKGGKPLRRT